MTHRKKYAPKISSTQIRLATKQCEFPIILYKNIRNEFYETGQPRSFFLEKQIEE